MRKLELQIICMYINFDFRCCVSNSDFKPLKSYNQKPEIIHCKELGEWRNDVDVRHGARREVRPESEILRGMAEGGRNAGRLAQNRGKDGGSA